MMATALTVANAFIILAEQRDESISNMKLQKLVYFAQGFHVALYNGRPLFQDEIQAWQYGPVIPDLYHKFKIYFAGPIPSTHPFKSDEKLTPDEQKFVEWVYTNLGQYTAMQLSDFSHAPESPWEKVFKSPSSAREIPVNNMSEYFNNLVVKQQSVAVN